MYPWAGPTGYFPMNGNPKNNPPFGPPVFAFIGVCMNKTGYIVSKVPATMGPSGQATNYMVNQYYLVNYLVSVRRKAYM